MIKDASRKLIVLAAIGLVNSKSQALSILGLTDSATTEDINKAFKIKAKVVHPDKPGGSHEEMQMLIAARDFLNSFSENPQVEESIPVSKENPLDFSYEDIANMRSEMGRDAFNAKFPGWESELKREMGLDAYNEIFEGYDPNYNPEDDTDYMADQDRMWDALRDDAYDLVSEVFDEGMENNKIDISTRISSLLSEEELDSKIPSWIKQKRLVKAFLKEVDKMFDEKIFKNLDDLEISFDDILSYPNEKFVKSFLSRDGNIESTEIPDSLFENNDFMRGIMYLLSSNFEKGKKFFDKYRNSKTFIDELVKSCRYFYYFYSNPDAVALVLSLPFTDEQLKIVKRFLKVK